MNATFAALVRTSAIPYARPDVPKVTMNDESRSLVTMRPLRRPMPAPARIAVRTPSVIASPRFGYWSAATCSGVPPTATITLAASTDARISD